MSSASKGMLLKSWQIVAGIIAFRILCFGGIFVFKSPGKNSPLCGKWKISYSSLCVSLAVNFFQFGYFMYNFIEIMLMYFPSSTYDFL